MEWEHSEEARRQEREHLWNNTFEPFAGF
jgi:hypothetical protein